MTTFLSSSYSETVHRLALGIEPRDAVRGMLAPRPLNVSFDEPAIAEWRIDRHRSGRFAICFARGLESPVNVRLADPRRRYVPRRLSFPIDGPGVDAPAARRTRHPALFPGAAYDTGEAVTGMRGQVTRAGKRMRWARVVATVGDTVVGRAHGDDRGEFLLILGTIAGDTGDLATALTIAVSVTAHGPTTVPVPPTPVSEDPLWDLPLELAPGPGVADDVSPAARLPGNYTRSAVRNLTLPLGRITSVRQPFVIP